MLLARRRSPWIRVVTNALLIVLVGLFLLVAARPTQSARVRTIPRSYVPIERQLHADDEIVEVVDDAHGISFDEAPTSEELTTYLIMISDVIATVEVQQVSSLLVDDGAWIHTEVRGTVQQVVRDQNRPLKSGAKLRFQMPGGQLTIGKVVVKTSSEVPSLLIGQRYLVFGIVTVDTGIIFPTHVPVLVKGDKLSSEWPYKIIGATIKDPLDGYSLQRVIIQARQQPR